MIGTLFGTGGPLYTLYLARRIAGTARLRASLGAVIPGPAPVRPGLFTGSGLLAQPGLLKLAALLVPCALAGYAAGSRVHVTAAGAGAAGDLGAAAGKRGEPAGAGGGGRLTRLPAGSFDDRTWA